MKDLAHWVYVYLDFVLSKLPSNLLDALPVTLGSESLSKIITFTVWMKIVSTTTKDLNALNALHPFLSTMANAN